MSDPTPNLTLAESLARAMLKLGQASGAARECHTQGIDVRQSYIEEAHRAIRDASDALVAYRMSQIKTVDERLAKLQGEMV